MFFMGQSETGNKQLFLPDFSCSCRFEFIYGKHMEIVKYKICLSKDNVKYLFGFNSLLYLTFSRKHDGEN